MSLAGERRLGERVHPVLANKGVSIAGNSLVYFRPPARPPMRRVQPHIFTQCAAFCPTPPPISAETSPYRRIFGGVSVVVVTPNGNVIRPQNTSKTAIFQHHLGKPTTRLVSRKRPSSGVLRHAELQAFPLLVLGRKVRTMRSDTLASTPPMRSRGRLSRRD